MGNFFRLIFLTFREKELDIQYLFFHSLDNTGTLTIQIYRYENERNRRDALGKDWNFKSQDGKSTYIPFSLSKQNV